MSLPSPQKRRFVRCAVAAVIGGLAATAAADSITVHKSLDVLSDKNLFSDPVDSVQPETTLERLGTEGSWIKVKTPSGKVGYLTADDVQKPLDLTGVAANASADQATAGLSGRGLEEDSKKFAQQHHLSEDGINAMVNLGKKISRKEVRDFAKAGGVGKKSK